MACKHVRKGLGEPVNRLGQCKICYNADKKAKAGIKVRWIIFPEILAFFVCLVLTRPFLLTILKYSDTVFFMTFSIFFFF